MLSLRKRYVIKYNICTSLDEVSNAINQTIIKQIQDKPNTILALGSEDILNSIYDRISKAQLKKINFADVIMFGIKDYIDIDPRYLKFSKFNLLNEHFLKLTNIKIDNINWPKENINGEYDNKIARLNGIDLLVLSMGANGYIGFNEPGTSLRTKTHNTALSTNTINHLVDIFDEKINIPTHGITMGIKTILSAKKIILVALGRRSAAAVSELMKGCYERKWPVTALVFHPNVNVYVDMESSLLLEDK